MIPINIQNIVVNTPPTKITSKCAEPLPLEISIRTIMLSNMLIKVNKPYFFVKPFTSINFNLPFKSFKSQEAHIAFFLAQFSLHA